MQRGYCKLYVDHVNQASEGADLDFLVGKSGAGRAAGQPLMARFLQEGLITDYDFPDLELEHAPLPAAGVEVGHAQCRTEERRDRRRRRAATALLVQYAPVNAKVFAALPRDPHRQPLRRGLRHHQHGGRGAARRLGRQLARLRRGRGGHARARAWRSRCVRHLPSTTATCARAAGTTRTPGRSGAPSDLTLGILGLGRIGKRMAHMARNCFGRVIACDPYIIDGDFPAYVERVGARGALSRRPTSSRCTCRSPTRRAASSSARAPRADEAGSCW